jgi:hypothetical protein
LQSILHNSSFIILFWHGLSEDEGIEGVRKGEIGGVMWLKKWSVLGQYRYLSSS